jgi:hypothetical protein
MSRDQQVNLSVTMMRRYLSAKGWRPLSPIGSSLDQTRSASLTPRFDLYVLSDEGSADIELPLPLDRDAADFDRRMQDVIRTLAEVEEAPPSQIVSAVSSIGFDVLKSRIPDELVKANSIDLSVATNFVNRMKSLLSATATTEIRPAPYFLRVKKDASDYADKCRFGHTFYGSFGFTVESPVAHDENLALFDDEPKQPFERRVMQRLATGISQIRHAVRENDLTNILHDVTSGFSANGYELLADLVEETASSGMTFEFSFSIELDPLEQFRGKTEYTIGPLHVEAARTAAKSLRSQEVSYVAEVAGRISRLQNDSDPSDIFNRTGEREIVVNWSNEDYGDLQVRVALPASDYLRAIDAHRTGKPVYVTGLLEHIGRRWLISNPTAFSASGE